MRLAIVKRASPILRWPNHRVPRRCGASGDRSALSVFIVALRGMTAGRKYKNIAGRFGACVRRRPPIEGSRRDAPTGTTPSQGGSL